MGKLPISPSSGNVFADLGIPNAEEHKLKAGLVAKLSEVIGALGLTQTAAAELTGIDQGDLSRILRGRFRNISAGRIMRAINRLGSDIDIDVSREGKSIGAPIHLEAEPA